MFSIHSMAATGPCAMTCRPPSTVWTIVYGLQFIGTPCHTSTNPPTSEAGKMTHSRARTRSTQKLPRPVVPSRAKPRMKAIPTANPEAPARKLWALRPAIWLT